MSDIENKVMGVETEKEKKKAAAANYFAGDALWEVSKKGCGTSLFTGAMVFEMLKPEYKARVKKGETDFTCEDFSFKLKK